MRQFFVTALSPESHSVKPAITFIKVDLPEPLAPVKAAFVPSERFTETSFNMSLSPKASDTFEN